MQRKTYLDSLKGFGICLVVLGHVIPDSFTKAESWIYSFHMPLFFIVSGMLLQTIDRETDSRAFLTRRLRTILWPYFTFCVIYAAMVFLQIPLGLKDMHYYIFDFLKELVLLEGYGALWFLPTLFLSQMLFLSVLKNLDRKYLPLLTLLAAAGISLLYVSPARELPEWPFHQVARTVIGFCFLSMGYLTRYLPAPKRVNRPLLVLFSAALLALEGFFAMHSPKADINTFVLGNPILFWGNAAAGTAGFLILSKLFLDHESILSFFGRNSLIIMVTHTPLLIFLGNAFYSFVLQRFLAGSFRYPVVFLLVMLLEYPVVLLCGRRLMFLFKYDAFRKLLPAKD